MDLIFYQKNEKQKNKRNGYKKKQVVQVVCTPTFVTGLFLFEFHGTNVPGPGGRRQWSLAGDRFCSWLTGFVSGAGLVGKENIAPSATARGPQSRHF